MPVCVECSCPVAHLWREVAAGAIRLSVCSQCGSVADRYIEYETILLLLDLVGQKRAAYRHLLYNTHSTLTRLLPTWLLLTAVVSVQLLVVAALTALSADSFTSLAHS